MSLSTQHASITKDLKAVNDNMLCQKDVGQKLCLLRSQTISITTTTIINVGPLHVYTYLKV